MQKVFEKTKGLTEKRMFYCPGCTHGVAHRLWGEAMEESGYRERAVGICPVGCSVFAYYYFNCDCIGAAHGRAPAVATGVKRTNPDKLVFTYQGDGDLAAIGTAEMIHSATRGENITIIFINNTIYGMTGGQMAPTTLPGERTTTTPLGRDTNIAGFPVRVCELLESITGVAYLERVSLDSAKGAVKTKNAFKKAIDTQMRGLGFSLVEVLSTCPTNWGLSPVKAMQWLRDNMIPYFPPKVFVDKLTPVLKAEKEVKAKE
jgi:2-oxoglutarate ferredoxin oxidoreductase subunit beta